MRSSVAAVALVGLSACQTTAPTASTTRDLMAGTSWSFTVPNAGQVIGTFGTNGHYYDLSGGKVVESGTFATAGGQVCEHVDGTPANDRLCWSLPNTLPPVGGTLTTTSSKGQTLTATRIAFRGNGPTH